MLALGFDILVTFFFFYQYTYLTQVLLSKSSSNTPTEIVLTSISDFWATLWIWMMFALLDDDDFVSTWKCFSGVIRAPTAICISELEAWRFLFWLCNLFLPEKWWDEIWVAPSKPWSAGRQWNIFFLLSAYVYFAELLERDKQTGK